MSFNVFQSVGFRRAGEFYWMCSCGWKLDASLEEAERMILGEEIASALAVERKAAQEERAREYIAKRQRGRHKKPIETKQFFLIGLAVEAAKPRLQQLIDKRRGLPPKIGRKPALLLKELLAAGFTHDQFTAGRSSKTAQNAARHFVSIVHDLPFDVVAEYHRDYLKKLRPPATPSASP